MHGACLSVGQGVSSLPPTHAHTHTHTHHSSCPLPLPTQFLRACDSNGTVGASELRDLIVAQDNAGVLEVLRSYYALGDAATPASPAKGVYRASSYIRLGGNEAAVSGKGL